MKLHDMLPAWVVTILLGSPRREYNISLVLVDSGAVGMTCSGGPYKTPEVPLHPAAMSRSV